MTPESHAAMYGQRKVTPRSHGLLFTAPMVRAVLANRKTQTRRLSDVWALAQPGDLLWVRETWAMRADTRPGTTKAKHYLLYRADQGPHQSLADEWHNYGRWRPSIHMPRWASRLTLRLTEKRRTRAQEISDADIAAEGITRETVAELLDGLSRRKRANLGVGVTGLADASPLLLWEVGWTVINGRDSWARNDEVWALSFERVEQQL